jgi:hypothetical protein
MGFSRLLALFQFRIICLCMHAYIVPKVLWSLLMLHTEGCRMCESFVVCEQMLRGQEVWRLHDGICR